MAVKVKRVLIVILIILIAILGIKMCEDSSEKTSGMPDEVVGARDSSLKAAQSIAHDLEGYQVDTMASAEELTDDSRSLLAELAQEYEAERVYVMTQSGEDFLLVADSKTGSLWHDKCTVDKAYDKALSNGFISARKTGWTDNKHYYWTAYAPLYDTNSSIRLLLAVDVLADGIKGYPEWLETEEKEEE